MRKAQSRTDQSRYLKLLPLAEVRRRIITSLSGSSCGIELIRVDRALGRVAAEDLCAPEDIPARPVAAMDGYAVRYSSLKGALPSNPVVLNVKGRYSPVDSGSPLQHITRGEAYHVSTGAPLPRGADLVIRVEDAMPAGSHGVKAFREFERWKNVSVAGEDVRRGSILLRAHQIVSSPDIAMLIACKRRTLRVFRQPMVGVLSVGDELREFGSESSTRKRGVSNNYSNLVRGFMEQHGVGTISLGVCDDDIRSIMRKIGSSLERLDAVCTIGGSSVGPADLTPDAVSSVVGAELVFHGVRVVPIKPAGLAIVKRRGMRKPIVIIPGHSVSASLTTFTIAIPVVNMISGLTIDSGRITLKASATEPFENTRPIDALVLARVGPGPNGEYLAKPLVWGSNLLSNLSKANSFVHLRAHESIPSSACGLFQIMGPLEMLRMEALAETPRDTRDPN